MTRRGFTLIELVVSLGIVAVLSLALGSTILLSTRTLPTTGGGPETQAAAGRALQILGADVRLATAASMPNNRTLILTVRDQTGDAAEETVTYAWGGTTGDPFTRTFNADVMTLLPSVADLEFNSITRDSVDTGDITTEPTERMRISISAGTAETTGVTAEFRLLNARTSGGGGGDDDDD